METTRRNIKFPGGYASPARDASLIGRLLAEVDRRDVEAVMSLLAPEVRVLTADGQQALGAQGVRELFERYLATIRSSSHEIEGEWNWGDVWIAEVLASYELRDWLRLSRLPRVFVVRESAVGITEVRIYGAHEHPLAEYRTDGMRIGGRWIPSL